MSLRKDLEQIIEDCRHDGWKITKNRKHYKWVPPNGAPCFFTPATPGDWRVPLNIKAQIKRALRTDADTL